MKQNQSRDERGHVRIENGQGGFAVTGIIEKDKIAQNSNAQPGDVFILTKPLGTGMTCFAYQIGRAVKGGMEAAIDSMTTLNKRASELMVEFKAHACTDVTGFSLMGHLTELARRSGVLGLGGGAESAAPP